MARALGIIPARYASTRFPGKLLAPLSGKPILQHVYERAARARLLDAVWIATDDDRIARAAERFGARAVMTSPDHATGSDRVAEAAALPEARDVEIVVNVQGDQPLIEPVALDGLVTALAGDPSLGMATLYEPIGSERDLRDPNVVKVVADRRMNALYFSRSTIPHAAGGGATAHWKHVGVYAFRKSFLFEFGRLERGPLERAESLEQLRVLEAGLPIRLVPSAGSSASVETPADLDRIRDMMSMAG